MRRVFLPSEKRCDGSTALGQASSWIIIRPIRRPVSSARSARLLSPRVQSLSGELPEGPESLLEHDADFFRTLDRVLVATLGRLRPRAESEVA